jgi:hypothetical protein
MIVGHQSSSLYHRKERLIVSLYHRKERLIVALYHRKERLIVVLVVAVSGVSTRMKEPCVCVDRNGTNTNMLVDSCPGGDAGSCSYLNLKEKGVGGHM